MGKFLLKYFIFSLIFLFLIIIYLAYFGIETDKFDQLIKQKVNESNRYAELEFNKTKIHLNARQLNIFVKLQDPKILIKGNEIKLSKIDLILSLKSLYKIKVILKKAEIGFKKNNISDLTKITNIYLPKFINKKIKKTFKKGIIEGSFKIPFSKDGRFINSYTFNGKILGADIIINNNYKIKNLTTLISYKKYPLEKIEELRIDVKKGSLLNLNLLDSQFQIKFENKRKIVESTIATKGKISFNDIKKISSLVGTKLDIFENLTLDSNLKTKINFIINNKFKLINKNYQIDGKINNLEFSLLHNKHIRNFIPTFNKNIKIKNSKINFNFPSADNQNQTLKLDGLINLSNKYEKINLFQSYNKNKKLFNINFFTNLNDSEISFPMLNYNKGKKNKAKLNANIDFVLKNFFLINSFEYEHDKNKIFLNNIKLNKNFEIYDFKRIEVLTHKDKKVNNNFKIIKSNQIIISGKVFDAEPILKSLYKNNTADREIFSKTVNSNVKVNFDKTLTGTFDIISDFSMIAEIKNGSYEKFILKGNYSKEDKIEISLYKIDDKTKTIEVVSDRATPFIKSLDFIKGFEGGKLVYDSTIFENSSKSNLLITNFKISKVPSLAKLLTLASLQGIADTLSGEGIRFESFEMKSNSQENILNIEDALAIGPAVSILLDGYVDNGKIVSLRGTLVPATKLNAIIASIPLVGDILVGKKTGDGVVGVSFKMKGPPKDIKTTVNPIKTLTPRFIIRAIEKAKKKSKTK